MVNYQELESAIRTRTPYRHGSSFGNIVNGVMDEAIYEIYSYTTLIALIDIQTGIVFLFNDKKYSTTTSRLQNIIKRNYRVPTKEVPVSSYLVEKINKSEVTRRKKDEQN